MRLLNQISRKFFIVLSVGVALCGVLAAVMGCNNGGQSSVPAADVDYNVAINELMANNRTGLQASDGQPTDWIEIKNNGADTVDLEGCTLEVAGMAQKKKDSKSWTFPSMKVGPGECRIVFAGKKKSSASDGDVRADVKLPKSGAQVKLLAPGGSTLFEMSYGASEPDRALALQPDGSYKPTFRATPGFENDREGYEASVRQIAAARRGPLLIWELMSRAEHSYENWVELKNISDSPVDLSSYSLSKKPDGEEAWTLPSTTLAPGQTATFHLMGRRAKTANQAKMKLGDAETLVLLKDGKFVDGLCARQAPYGCSVGRKAEADGIYYFREPTKGEENRKTGHLHIADAPRWDRKAGVYKDKDKIVLRLANPGRNVRYTLDGSEPTSSSALFKDSLVLAKSTVVRSYAEGDSATMQSPVATATYLLGVDHDLPVINISVKNADLHDHNTGIYAKGPGYVEGEHPYTGANFWKNWTKKAHVELFDGKEGFASDCGLKIFGGYSRALDKKSLRLKFRGMYGNSKANYDFFETGEPMEFEDLVLRSGSQDYNKFMIKDEFFTSLAQSGSETLMTQMYRPVALYINAEYFGLYYLREKIDDNFVARKLNLPSDSIDVVLSGANPFTTFVGKLAGMDITKPENYALARDNIDFQGLLDFKIGNIFTGKTDLGNIRYARSRHPDSDRKWYFIYYDIDASWSASPKPGVAYALSTSPNVISEEKKRYNVLINKLLQNKDFRQLFLERFSYHLTNTYSPEKTTAYFDKFVGAIRKEMKYNCERWPRLKYDRWEKNMEEFRARLERRPKIILEELRTYLSVTEEENKKYFSHLGY